MLKSFCLFFVICREYGKSMSRPLKNKGIISCQISFFACFHMLCQLYRIKIPERVCPASAEDHRSLIFTDRTILPTDHNRGYPFQVPDQQTTHRCKQKNEGNLFYKTIAGKQRSNSGYD